MKGHRSVSEQKKYENLKANQSHNNSFDQLDKIQVNTTSHIKGNFSM